VTEPTDDELTQRLAEALQKEEDAVKAATERAQLALEQQRQEQGR
jgi:hypothetical protein